MLDNVITWLMKRLILLWDRHNDKLAFSFGRDERTDYSVLVERFYDDYYTVGTAMYPYNKGGGGKLMYEELVKRLRSHSGWALNKTLDEAADAIESTNKAYQMISEAYEAEVTKQNWIPVTERLPKNQRPVLVCVSPYTDGEEESDGYVGMAYFTDSANGGFWCGTDGNVYGAIGIIHEPSYWMPLPEPPKEET